MIINEKTKKNIPDTSILYISAVGNYTILFTINKQIVTSLSLKKLSERVGAGFVRISQTHLVNINHIDHVFENQVFVHGTGLPISRRNLKSVKTLLNKD